MRQFDGPLGAKIDFYSSSLKLAHSYFKMFFLSFSANVKYFFMFTFKGHTGTIDSSMKFSPSYYWSFTLFKNKQYNTLYLGCGSDGGLLPMNTEKYPDPRVLFITNEYVLDQYQDLTI